MSAPPSESTAQPFHQVVLMNGTWASTPAMYAATALRLKPCRVRVAGSFMYRPAGSKKAAMS